MDAILSARIWINLIVYVPFLTDVFWMAEDLFRKLPYLVSDIFVSVTLHAG